MLQLLNHLKSDESLMQAYRRGDTAAFELLYLRHKDGLFAFLFRSCQRTAVVEELAQDTWMAVINAVERYRPEARFKTWLYQIAHNRLVDHWRRPDNKHSSLEASAAQVAENPGPQSSELERDLMALIGELPRDQCNALLLQEQGFSLADISEITGIGEQTIKSRLRYARNQLRVLLEKES